MTTPTFDSLELSERTLAAVASAGYTTPTEIQHRTIPELISGRDVLATAQTGTGKTAAFVLPMLQLITKAQRAKGAAAPSALILTPTRELALQIVESIGVYGKGSGLRTVAIYGGASRNKQIDDLRSGPDIVVATPGRLEDLMADRRIGLKRVRYLVLDEADRMLDMGFIPAVRRIVSQVSDVRQTALFSATMPDPIKKLAAEFLEKPVTVQAEAGEVNVDRIAQSVMYIDQANKLTFLPDLIRDKGMYKVLVFTRTKHRARKVAKVLDKENLRSDSIHGDKSQAARNRALDSFKKGRIQVLVATDVASRGIDVDDVTHVVNFEIPNEPETYVHRIGRTARAGADGDAISLCDSTEMKFVRDIERLTGAAITLDRDHPYHEDRAEQKRGGAKPRGNGGGNGRGRNNTHPGPRPQGGSPSRGGDSRRRGGTDSRDRQGQNQDHRGGSSGGHYGNRNDRSASNDDWSTSRKSASPGKRAAAGRYRPTDNQHPSGGNRNRGGQRRQSHR